MTTKLEVPNSTHISFNNRWVRLGARDTEQLLTLIDYTMLADLHGEATSDIVHQLNVVGDQMLEVMNHLEFGDTRIIHGGFDDEIEDGAG